MRYDVEVIKTLSAQGFADLQIVNGSVNCLAIEFHIGSYALAVKSEHPIKITTHDDCSITTHGIVCCGMVKSVDVSDARVIFITNKASAINGLLFKPGVINIQHENIIADILDSEMDIAQSSYSAALLTKLLIFEQELNERQNSLLLEIKRNAANPNYNLDSLCETIHVSRRKAQYLFSKQHTTFLHEIKKYRVARLKELMNRPENFNKPKASLAYQAGFRNLQSAQRDFLAITQTSLNSYMRLLKKLT